MKLEVGKFYKTRNGEVAGPLTTKNKGITFGTDGFSWSEWYSNGRCLLEGEHERDLISEWEEGPVRTVSRKEIVPGMYGKVCVQEKVRGGGLFGVAMVSTKDPNELREAAHILNQIAEALEDGAK